MHFEKISFEQWAKDTPFKDIPHNTLLRQYYNIQLPNQSTENAMGLDFYMPYEVKVLAHNKIKISTGVRWICDEENDGRYGMLIVPRSSTGIKLGLRLLNTIGIIDADYYFADNEGHIMLFMENTTDEDIVLQAGQRIVQGLIVPYVIPKNMSSNKTRHGGFGSTDNN